MAEFICALDQGTTSTRCIIFDHDGVEIARSQLEQRQSFPYPGWVEQDADEIWRDSTAVIVNALDRAHLGVGDLVGIGLANQRESVLVWDKRTGEPLAPAISWQDVRTADAVAALGRSERAAAIRAQTGLPISTYPSASKLAWLLQHVDGARGRAERGEVLFGTIDSWLAWKMSGEHVTDVTNASRTMLMDLVSLDWDDALLELFGIPRAMLPRVHASTFTSDEMVATRLGEAAGELPITGILGDQQAALVGHRCFAPHEAKNTYGTGSFLLVNTGTTPVYSSSGLITTVGYQFGNDAPRYALEGAVAVVGAAVQWLRDQLGVVASADEVEALAGSVPDSAGVYFVPAFAGLFAPHWRGDARGTVFGLARAHTRAHLARAVLEAIGFQTLDVVEAIEEDLGKAIADLRVDGGVSVNSLCMQLQADILGVPVVRDGVTEATALGAAYAAGLGSGYWASTAELPTPLHLVERQFDPRWSTEERRSRIKRWKHAVQLSLDWADAQQNG
jgi:glycerol kinase